VVEEEKLSDVLSEFARTMATDFPIQGILDHLVKQIVEVLPVTAAGVTLISEGRAPRYIAASDASALAFEQLQSQIGEGPCISAFHSGEAVAVPDLREDRAFPRFSPAAIEAGLAAVFTFPLRHGDGRIGALDLYRDIPGVLQENAMQAAQTLADVATAYLLNATAREEARETSDRFRHNSLHDPLTGLANRLLLQERLDHAALRARRTHTNSAVFFLDLDRFKQVNDTFGHQAGDELLVAVGQRLTAVVRPGDTLARFSGDEFVIFCEDLTGAQDIDGVVRRIQHSFDAPFGIGDHEVAVTASIGVAFAGPGENITNRLVSRADLAMYRAKGHGGGHEVVDLRENPQSPDDDSLEQDLRGAFGEQCLEIAYQPIISLADGGMVAVEALLRWTHHQRGHVPALSIIAVAEQTTLINEIGEWVLERSCLDRSRWLRAYPGVSLDLAVNVSPRQLMTPGFPKSVESVLTRTGMDPAALVLEVTESIYIDDSERTRLVLSALKALGVRLALDDFGTGYSSLSYLRRLPIDIVKIDRTFVADVDRVSTGAPIVAAVTNLAHVLGLVVTAEGVETETQREQLIAVGCELAQGFLFDRPMAATEIGQRLA
jgi:diguanylate cyclase (GGDEF)-like protein